MGISRPTVELHFFPDPGEASVSAPSPSQSQSHPPTKSLDRPRSFRDIQSVVSKLNPELLKTVIESASANQTSIGKASDKGSFSAANKSFSALSSPRDDQTPFPPLPVYVPTSRPSSDSETSPMTIFYNGMVTVFDVSPHEAENILKVAENRVPETPEATDAKLSLPSRPQLLGTLNGDMPIVRKKSLQRFLEKRKERV